MDSMWFPETVYEFMNSYKILDTEQVYTNGAELVPIFRMKQWFEHIDAVPVVRCKDCVHGKLGCPEDIVCDYWDSDGLDANDFCSYGERRE